MQGRKLLPVCLLPVSLLLVSCVGSSPFSTARLDGNWHLTGQNFFATNALPSSSQGAFLAMAIGVSGNTVYASGDSAVTCSNISSGMGGTFWATGLITSNGSFTLSNSSVPQDTIQYTIKGTAPAAGASAWQGSYTLVNSSSSVNCTFNQSGSFTAAAYPLLNGTYTGALDNSSTIAGAENIQLVVKVAQGEPTFTTAGTQDTAEFYIPLNGSITVSGTSCFTSGTMASGVGSRISGDNFYMTFTMNDGSTLTLAGLYGDETETTLKVTALPFASGNSCYTGGGGTLTLQQ